MKLLFLLPVVWVVVGCTMDYNTKRISLRPTTIDTVLIEHCSTRDIDTIYVKNKRINHYSRNGGYPVVSFVDSNDRYRKKVNFCGYTFLNQQP